MSSAEAEYVSLSACCAQVLWLKLSSQDYRLFTLIKYLCINDLKGSLAPSRQIQSIIFTLTTAHRCQDHTSKSEQVKKEFKSLVDNSYEMFDSNETGGLAIEKILLDPSNINLSYALSWKPCQGDSLNLPDHRSDDGDAAHSPVK
ncbi:hypothetical protein Tco_1253108 [Tanacetum coccineum]